MQASKRIVINTGFLYGKMLITMLISLYTVRLVLDALGSVDYGIFSLIGGVIAMLSFLNGAMTVSTQRYLSFYLGAGEDHKLKSVFSSSIILHLIISLLIVLLLELGSIYIFDGALKIPDERIGSAKVLYQCMVVSTFFTINAVPYDAAINTHENMLFDALVGIFESIIKLGIAIGLIYAEVDKLILYGLLIAGLTILIRIIKGVYCYRKYEECRIRINSYINVSLLKEMISFAGWNLFGSLCAIVRNQGLAIVLNIFFGVLVNAAYAIAGQVSAQLNSFSENMLRALNPQIVKSEGFGDRKRMLRLAMLACKVSFLLLAFFAIPVLIEMSFILHIWLKKVPGNTIIFCQLFLVLSLVQQLTVGMMSAIQSGGRIKAYQAVIGSLIILNLPLAYVLLKLGFPAYSVLVGSIFLECFAGGMRIWFAHKLVELPAFVFLRYTLSYSALSVILALIFTMLPQFFLEESIYRVILTGIISTISILFFARYIAFTASENEKIEELINSLVLKTHKLFIKAVT